MKRIKRAIKLLVRFKTDLINRNLFKFAKKRTEAMAFNHIISITQEIKPSDTFQDKLFNISLASERIDGCVLLPNELFSFWKMVKSPDAVFKKGRTLMNGKIVEENGGGICQVSGIVYYISMIAGMQILERYNHSLDIYTEETRFAPLGADATVVYGYKDLRIKNNSPFPVKLDIKVVGNQIKANLLSTQKIKEQELFFKIENIGNDIRVEVVNEELKLINRSIYKKISS